jgi:hypothetical protein
MRTGTVSPLFIILRKAVAQKWYFHREKLGLMPR